MTAEQTQQSLFGDVVQPEALSLFSSTSSDPLALWAAHQDADLPEDSGIRLVIDGTDNVAPNDPGNVHESFVLRSEETPKGTSSEAVLHIQSPAIRNTFIRSPAAEETQLRIQLAYISFQFRAIGSARPFALEIGVQDESGRRGSIRISSFQTEPKLYLAPRRETTADTNAAMKTRRDTTAILHLPLTMAPQPENDETSLTPWQVLTLDLDRLARHLSDTSLAASPDSVEAFCEERIFGSFHSIAYVKVYANVRLRRIWCSRHLPDHDLPEFQLFS